MIGTETLTQVLVVEDDFLIAQMLETAISKVGYGVLGPVATTDEALGLISKRAPDLAILDVNLIGGSSVAVAKVLMARACPFLFATGYANPPIDLSTFAAVPLLRKPIELPQLFACMANMLAP